MAWFAWFDAGAEAAFAEGVAADLVRRVPPASLQSGNKRKQARVERMHDSVLAQVAQYTRQRRPNLYQKAVLGNRFQQALRQAGYPDDIVTGWTYELTEAVALAGSGGR